MNPQRWKWLWTLALLVTVANALVVVWRLPVQKKLANDADEQAVQDAAGWIAPLPTGTRLLLLASNQDPTYFHFHTRLIYFLYPHRIDIALNQLPPDAASRYDGILAFGRMAPVLEARRKSGSNVWRLAERDTAASLFLAARFTTTVPFASPAPRLPFVARLLSGLFSIVIVVVLGALLLRLTLRAPPFGAWWANLAVAHLVGATAFAVAQQVCVLLTGKPLVWPVYALLLFLFLLWWRGRHTKHTSVGAQFMASNADRASNVGVPPNAGIAALANVSPNAGVNCNAGVINHAPTGKFLEIVTGNPGCWAALLLGVFTVLERLWLIGLDWDALAIWQLKARMLFLDGNLAAWQNTAPFPYAHFDYPLLTPLLTWWTYRHFDGIDLHWAQANGLLFYADLLVIFAASAIRYVPAWAALSAASLLSGLPEVTLHAVSGYADLPVSVYFLGAGVFLIRALNERETGAWPLVGWMLAGVILVKNEGLLACLSAFIVIGLHLYHSRLAPTDTPDNSRNKRASFVWLLAPGLAYLPWWLLKHRWALSNDVMQPVHPPHFTIRLLWWRMWYAILYGFGRQMLWLGPWFPAWGLLGVITLAGIAAAYRRRLHPARPLWLLAGIQLCGYIGIYMITPSALPAHIISSVDRLTLHVAPTLLLAALISCFSKETHAVQIPAQTE